MNALSQTRALVLTLITLGAFIGTFARPAIAQHDGADVSHPAQRHDTSRWQLTADLGNAGIGFHLYGRDTALRMGHHAAMGHGYIGNPMFGAAYRWFDNATLYAAYGRSVRTSFVDSSSYRTYRRYWRSDRTARASSIGHVELGMRAAIDKYLSANLALFRTDSVAENGLAYERNDRTLYQFAGNTRRDGMALSLDGQWPNGVGVLVSHSLMSVLYADSICGAGCVASSRIAGAALPGRMPEQMTYGELSWRYPRLGFSAAIGATYIDTAGAEGVNRDSTAAFFAANARFGLEQKFGGWRIQEFARIDNVAVRNHGNTFMNDAIQSYEPSTARRYLIGIEAGYSW